MNQMKLVVLDGYTANPGDLSWSALEGLGECQIFARTARTDIATRAAQADIVLTNKTVLDGEVLSALPRLRYIGVLATGYNVVDIRAARERSIAVANVPAYGTRSVAQMAFALLLELTQNVGHHAHTVRAGRWAKSADFCYWDKPLVELQGLTLGIIGFGEIGQAAARLGTAFGMEILASRRPRHEPRDMSVQYVELETLLRRSDVVSLHCPLTPETTGFLNAERLRLMKPTAFLLNTSRGPLVNESDLADALNSGALAGAGLDVLEQEPPRPDNPLFAAQNCFITPHIAWATRASRERLIREATENVRAFCDGERRNRVD